MQYTAMPGSIIIKTEDKGYTTTRNDGLIIVEAISRGITTIAEILSVGDVRDDLKVGMKILFPTTTGLMIDKNVYYLKYEDICAVVNDQ